MKRPRPGVADRRRRMMVLRERTAAADAGSNKLAAVAATAVQSDADLEMTETIVRKEACVAASVVKEFDGGAPLQLEVQHSGTEESCSVVLEQPFAVLGRSRDCDLRLIDDEVDLRHAYLQQIDRRILWIDLHNGVERRLQRRSGDWLTAGDIVSVGPFRLRLPEMPDPAAEDSDFEWPHEQPLGATDPDMPEVALRLQKPAATASRRGSWRVKRQVTLIGSGTNCHLQLRHKSVAPVHCSLVLTDRGLWVVDLLSGEDTSLDGRPIRFARLDHGSQLRIGAIVFRVDYDHGDEIDEVAAVSRLGFAGIGGALPDGNMAAMTGNGAITDVPSLSNGQGQLAGTGAFSEAFVLQLVNQMSSMQMQMQMQMQAMNQMVQTFQTMQQDYLSFIRDDLCRIQELTLKLQDLQWRLMQHRIRHDGQLQPNFPTPHDVPLLTEAGRVQPAPPMPAAPVQFEPPAPLSEPPVDDSPHERQSHDQHKEEVATEPLVDDAPEPQDEPSQLDQQADQEEHGEPDTAIDHEVHETHCDPSENSEPSEDTAPIEHSEPVEYGEPSEIEQPITETATASQLEQVAHTEPTEHPAPDQPPAAAASSPPDQPAPSAASDPSNPSDAETNANPNTSGKNSEHEPLESYEWLFERIREVTEERDSLWQKISRTLTGQRKPGDTKK